MSGFTKGPWLFRGKSNSVYTAPPIGSVYTYGSIIFSFHDVAEPSDSDLALVLAAPDLLEALKMLVESNTQHSSIRAGDALDAARKAIAKALASNS